MVYSYLSIDIGYDPRVHSMAVTLPRDATGVVVAADGHLPRTVLGDRDALCAALVDAGFQLRDEEAAP